MKKSMLMLVALFVLGACSTTSDSSNNINYAWRSKMGGVTLTSTSDEHTLGTFSADTSTFTVVAGIIEHAEYYYTDSVFYIIEESATSTSASYLSKDKTTIYQMDFEILDNGTIDVYWYSIGNNTTINNDTQKTYFHIEGSFSK